MGCINPVMQIKEDSRRRHGGDAAMLAGARLAVTTMGADGGLVARG